MAIESRRGRVVVGALVCIAVLCGGVLIGRSLDGPAATSVSTVTATVTASTADGAPAAGFTRTPAGAAEAASSYLVAFDAETIFDPARLRAIIDRVVARGAQEQVASAYASAAADLRRRFGMDGQPHPIVILRAAPLGYRVTQFDGSRAVVAVWDVGVLGSGAGLDPTASWRTDEVTLVWEDGTWKAQSFHSTAGPTPALAAPGGVTPPGDVFSIVPGFAEYGHVAP